MNYDILYSPEALEDLRSIYKYIAFELQASESAEGQVKRIRSAIRKLDTFPEGHSRVDWDPWSAMGMRFLPVDNFIVYYMVDNVDRKVQVVRIFYGGRDIEHIIQVQRD